MGNWQSRSSASSAALPQATRVSQEKLHSGSLIIQHGVIRVEIPILRYFVLPSVVQANDVSVVTIVIAFRVYQPTLSPVLKSGKPLRTSSYSGHSSLGSPRTKQGSTHRSGLVCPGESNKCSQNPKRRCRTNPWVDEHGRFLIQITLNL